MWFKNLILYRLSEPFEHSPEEVAEALESDRFKPCGGLEASSFGWERPLGRIGSELVHAANGRILLCARKEQRLLPPAVVRESMEERLERIETHENRTPSFNSTHQGVCRARRARPIAPPSGLVAAAMHQHNAGPRLELTDPGH